MNTSGQESILFKKKDKTKVHI